VGTAGASPPFCLLALYPITLMHHCERSEAIQKLMSSMLDCFVALSGFLAMTDLIPHHRFVP
jgi:hypothetical protein